MRALGSGRRAESQGDGQGTPATAADTPVTDDERNAEVRAKLAKRTNIEFIETPLNQVLDFLSDAAAGANSYQDSRWTTWASARTSPMTLNLKDVSVETGLELMLDDCGWTLRSIAGS